MPHKTSQEIRRQHPNGLNRQPLIKRRTTHPLQINVYRKKYLIRKRRELQDLKRRRRQNIQREQMASGNVFKSEHDEDERRDFHDPERQQSHRVADKKLQEPGQDQRQNKPSERAPIVRHDKMLALDKDKARHREQRTTGKDESPRPV